MKLFSVNKNSWHYKLNLEMCQTNGTLKSEGYAQRYVQSKDNLCSYWQLTLYSIFKVLVVATFVLAVTGALLWVLYMIGYGFIYHTAEALVTTGVLTGFVAFLIGIIMLGTWLDNRKKIKLNKILHDGETETSLAKAKYSSWKNGFCVPVEFKE
jgi:cytochrome b subunit of formate dehydrogenase